MVQFVSHLLFAELHWAPAGQQAPMILGTEGVMAEASCLTQMFALTESDTPVGQPQFEDPTVPTHHQPSFVVQAADNLPDKRVCQLVPLPPPVQGAVFTAVKIHTVFVP